ncbi:MAG TPA: DUF4383 domain-containing protein [Nocardioidaceae bacterium]|jgi:hypothetical protein|nr:DUF4383 domain-containing protein [Nocardioidaceae bacterium]
MAARNRASGKRATGLHQPIATVVGVVFLLVGIAGFIPGITTNYDLLEFAGHESGAELLGLFEVSMLHNAVHLLFGVAGLALARSESTARAYLLGGGVIYLLLFVYGLVIDMDSAANFVPVNDADNWLHLGLGLGMLALGLIPDRSSSRDDNRTRNTPGGRDRPADADRDPKPVGRAHGDSGRPGREDLSDRQRRQGRGRS